MKIDVLFLPTKPGKQFRHSFFFELPLIQTVHYNVYNLKRIHEGDVAVSKTPKTKCLLCPLPLQAETLPGYRTQSFFNRFRAALLTVNKADWLAMIEDFGIRVRKLNFKTKKRISDWRRCEAYTQSPTTPHHHHPRSPPSPTPNHLPKLFS